MALYIFSDVHLGSNNSEKEKLKIEKLKKLFEIFKKDCDYLIILGDLFEFWFEYKNTMPKEHFKVLFMLNEFVEQNIPVEYVCGNHDFWMDDFFEKQMGIKVHIDSFDLNYKGLKIYFTHGDGIAKSDRGYRLLKKILRNRFNIWAYRKLPTDWAIPLAKFVAGQSRERTSNRYDIYSSDYEEFAKNKLENDYDVVAIGHLHKPIIKSINNGTYVNSGDFIEHFSYVKIENGRVNLEKI